MTKKLLREKSSSAKNAEELFSFLLILAHHGDNAA